MGKYSDGGNYSMETQEPGRVTLDGEMAFIQVYLRRTLRKGFVFKRKKSVCSNTREKGGNEKTLLKRKHSISQCEVGVYGITDLAYKED